MLLKDDIYSFIFPNIAEKCRKLFVMAYYLLNLVMLEKPS